MPESSFPLSKIEAIEKLSKIRWHLFFLLITLRFFDLVVTAIGLRLGMVELNPIVYLRGLEGLILQNVAFIMIVVFLYIMGYGSTKIVKDDWPLSIIDGVVISFVIFSVYVLLAINLPAMGTI